MTDPTERLIAAWMRWESAPSSATATREKFDAIRALGLDPIRTAETVADNRRAGMSVPDAVQAVINDERTTDR